MTFDLLRRPPPHRPHGRRRSTTQSLCFPGINQTLKALKRRLYHAGAPRQRGGHDGSRHHTCTTTPLIRHVGWNTAGGKNQIPQRSLYRRAEQVRPQVRPPGYTPAPKTSTAYCKHTPRCTGKPGAAAHSRSPTFSLKRAACTWVFTAKLLFFF